MTGKMTRVLLIGLLAAIGQLTQVVASPAPSTYVHPPNGICTDLTVTEPVKATYPIWGLPKFESNYDVVSFLFNLSRKDGAVNTPSPVSGFQNLTKTYTVAATFCKPRTPVGDKESTVLVATHGLGYDGRYVEKALRGCLRVLRLTMEVATGRLHTSLRSTALSRKCSPMDIRFSGMTAWVLAAHKCTLLMLFFGNHELTYLLEYQATTFRSSTRLNLLLRFPRVLEPATTLRTSKQARSCSLVILMAL